MILEKENNNKNKSREYKLLSLDIDIRQHIKKRIKNNFLKKYYKTFQGSSISKEAKNFVNSNTKQCILAQSAALAVAIGLCPRMLLTPSQGGFVCFTIFNIN